METTPAKRPRKKDNNDVTMLPHIPFERNHSLFERAEQLVQPEDPPCDAMTNETNEHEMVTLSFETSDGLVRFRESDHRYWVRSSHNKPYSSQLTFSVSKIYSLAKQDFPKWFIATTTADRNLTQFEVQFGDLHNKGRGMTDDHFLVLAEETLGSNEAARWYLDWKKNRMYDDPPPPLVQRGGKKHRSREFHVAASMIRALKPESLQALSVRAAEFAAKSEHVFPDGSLPLSPAQIVTAWEAKRDTAAALGTKMHAAIERFYKGQSVEGDSDILNTHGFTSLLRDHPEFSKENCVRVEAFLYWPELRIPGTADALFWERNDPANPDRITGLHLVDWKRVEDLTAKESGNSAFLLRFPRFPCTKGGFYSLQLSLYARILERHGMKVLRRTLVGLYPTTGGSGEGRFQVYPAVTCEAETDYVLSLYQDTLFRPAVMKMEDELREKRMSQHAAAVAAAAAATAAGMEGVVEEEPTRLSAKEEDDFYNTLT